MYLLWQIKIIPRTIHESGTLDMDIREKKAYYISRCLDVQEAFLFAAPDEMLRAIELYAADMFGRVWLKMKKLKFSFCDP